MAGIEWMLAGLAALVVMVASGQLWFTHRVFKLFRAVTAVQLDALLLLSKNSGSGGPARVLLRVANLSNANVWLDKAAFHFGVRYVSDLIESDLPLHTTVEPFSIWEREVSELVWSAAQQARRDPGTPCEMTVDVEVLACAGGRELVMARAIGLCVGQASISLYRQG